MKIIGKGEGYDPEYICTLKMGELQKYLGTYYNNGPEIKVGDTVDLGRGHDYASKIESAMRATRELVTTNQAVVTAIMQGMSIEAIVAAAKQQAESPPPDGRAR